MALLKIRDFATHYEEVFGDRDIIRYSVYSDEHEKIGVVEDILVDEATGTFRYLIVDIGLWIFGKSVLLPIGRARIDFAQQRVYAKGLTRQQVEHLPEFSEDLRIDHDYEERVRSGYRSSQPVPFDPLANTDPYGHPIPPTTPYGPMAMTEVATLSTPHPAPSDEIPDQMNDPGRRDLFRYEDDPDLYGVNETEHPSIRAYSERLVSRFQHDSHHKV